MRFGGGFSIVLIMAGGMLTIVMLVGNEKWLGAPKAIAPAIVSEVINCNIIDDDKICSVIASRTGKMDDVWSVKLPTKYDIVTKGQTIYRLCWFENSFSNPKCFDNAIFKPVGPWRNTRII